MSSVQKGEQHAYIRRVNERCEGVKFLYLGKHLHLRAVGCAGGNAIKVQPAIDRLQRGKRTGSTGKRNLVVDNHRSYM